MRTIVATITKIKNLKSKYGKKFYYVFFKYEAGKNYKTCIYPNMRNYRNNNWFKFLQVGLTLGGLEVVSFNNSIINADSKPYIIEDNTLKQSKHPKLF